MPLPLIRNPNCTPPRSREKCAARGLFGVSVVLVALAVVAVVGGSLTVVLLVIGLLLWDQFAVVARTATQQLRNSEYVAAARAMGTTHLHVMIREIMPNIRAPLIVVATVEMANAVLIEAALSFIGAGVPPDVPTWGNIMAEGRMFFHRNFSIILFPGLFLAATVFAINALGDGLRDRLDPRMARRLR